MAYTQLYLKRRKYNKINNHLEKRPTCPIYLQALELM